MRPLFKHVAVGSFLVFLLLPSITSTVAVHATSPSKATIGPNIDISNLAGPQAETGIAINPKNPLQIVAVSTDYPGRGSGVVLFDSGKIRAYFSSDGGITWGSTLLPVPPPINNSALLYIHLFDEGIAWDTLGNVYVSYQIYFQTAQFANLAAEMAVARSSNAGHTWNSTYFEFIPGFGTSPEKTLIAIDTNPTSPFRDTIYIAYDLNFNLPATPLALLLSRSTDHGATFSSPVSPTGPTPDSHLSRPFDADPFVGPDGSLYVAWNDITKGIIAISSSTDGGLTFGPATTIGSAPASEFVPIPAVAGPVGGAGESALVYPTCGADTSASTHRGTLYCAWINETASSGLDIFEAHSTDHGATWSRAIRVNDDPMGVANDQFAPWLATDPLDGRVSMVWYDTRNNPTHLSVDVFYASSTDGGLTFSPNGQVTTAPTNESCGSSCGAFFLGDYIGVAALGGVVHSVWTDRRASVASLDEEIFTATITIKGPANQSQIPTPLTPSMILLTTLLASATLALVRRRQE